MRMLRRSSAVALLLSVALLTAACGSDGSGNKEATPEGEVEIAPGLVLDTYPTLEGTVTLARSPGVLFAAFAVMQQAKVLERMAPNMDVEWRTINETSQQRDALLAGELDFTSCSSWPFVQGWASGVPWKVVGVTNVWDGELFVEPGTASSLEDFVGTGMKISPGPGTTQDFVSAVYLDQQGGDSTGLADNWTLIPHAEAIDAVANGQLEGEFATGEYVLQARERKLKSIFKLSDANGGQPFASACAAVAKDYLETDPAVVRMYADALREVSRWIASDRGEAAKILADGSGGEADAAFFEKALSDTGITDFSRDDGFMEQTGSALKELDVINKVPESPEDIYVYPEETGEDW